MTLSRLRQWIIFSLYFTVAYGHISCHGDNDCPYLNLCNHQKVCEHKHVFPLSTQEIIGFIVLMIGSAVSNAGGIGGGGLLIPILLVILNFNAEAAIPISKLMIFAGALTSFIIGFKVKHPKRNAISIDYNIPMILIPMLLFGTMTGVTLNKVFPSSVILVLLTLVLIINTCKTFIMGVKKFKKETASMKNKQQIDESESDLSSEERRVVSKSKLEAATGSLSRLTNDDIIENKKITSKEKRKEKSEENTDAPSEEIRFGNSPVEEKIVKEIFFSPRKESLLRVEKKDLKKFPVGKVIYMFISYVVMITLSLLKGSREFKSLLNIEPCSAPYWIIYFSYFMFAIVLTIVVARKIANEYKYKQELGYAFLDCDVQWNTKIFIIYPIYAFISGVLAGLLGIGGGLILGPLLLDLGLDPIVSSATSNFLVLFTASSTSVQFMLLGMMNYNYGLACVIVSSVGSLFGTLLIQRLVKKSGRSSILILVLAGVLAIATLVIPIDAILKIIDMIKKEQDIWKFESAC